MNNTSACPPFTNSPWRAWYSLRSSTSDGSGVFPTTLVTMACASRFSRVN